MIKAAQISDCGTYRYTLTRNWDEKKSVLPFIMLNPSTADADIDDPTIRRCIGFAKIKNAGGIIVGNLCAYRVTDPAELQEADDPFGPLNVECLQGIADDAKRSIMPVVCAWGAHGSQYRAASVIVLFRSRGVRLICLGMTKEGQPRHPLYVSNDQPFIPYEM